METMFYIAAVGLAIVVAAGLRHRALRRQDAVRRHAERETYERRREAERLEQTQTAVADLVDRYFPFARAAWAASNGRGTARERLRRALREVEGVVVGVADIGFDAVLPDCVRRQHFMMVGKSGYGKTTVALHLILGDLIREACIFILGFEPELFRDWVLPLVPTDRMGEVVYFKPADPACTLTWNPLQLEEGEDQPLAAGELFEILKRAIGETTIGARADTILANAFAVLVGRPGATLLSVIRLLEDDEYRAQIVESVDDPYLARFWSATFPEYPSSAALPLVNRLNRFLRMPQVRASLCHPVSSFSIRVEPGDRRILYIDLSGLDPDTRKVVGQMFLSKFQLELMRRERVPEEQRTPVHVYVDEFHAFAGAAEGTWREMLARGRRYGLGLHLLTQHLKQLPLSLQHEIFGNVSSLIALNLSADGATSVRRELLVPGPNGVPKPVPAEVFVSLPVGEGFARLGAGACALRVRFAPPIPRPDVAVGDRVREMSWKTFAAPPMPSEEQAGAALAARDTTANDVTETVSSPGRGGPLHKMLQQQAKQWGEELGFRASLEEGVLGGAGRVDVVLTREHLRVAIEVSVTSSTAEVTATVGKCVASGFDHVLVVGNDEAALGRAERAALEVIPAKDRGKLRFVLPDGLKSFLDGLTDSESPLRTTAGYTIRVQTPAPGCLRRRRELARLVGTALLRRRPSS